MYHIPILFQEWVLRARSRVRARKQQFFHLKETFTMHLVKLKNLIYSLILATSFLPLSSPQLPAATQAVSGLPEFTQVADMCMPCVVSIRVELLKKKNPVFYGNEEEDAPLDSMQEEMLRRFFGLPPMQQKSPKKAPAMAQGSGFVISQDGYILTNNHVVDDASQITVYFLDGREYKAKLVGGDANTDVALLKIDAKDLPYLSFGDSDKLKIGEWVAAIGSPLGLQGSFTVGIVSAKGRTDLDIIPVEEFIQTDATMNVGNSGGPLVNLKGEVMGINAAIATNGGGSVGIGFTIPSKIVKRVKDELMKNGKVTRGFVGVMLQRVDSDLAKLFGLKKAEGALVTDVVKDGPAEKAGIKAEDLILKVNGQSIDTPAGLRNAISLLQPGEKATLTIKRGDKEIEIPLYIGAHPEQELAAQDVQNNLGVLVQELTPELQDELGYKNDKGVVIKYVAPNSVAQYAGLKRGQLIMSINRKPIKNTDDFYRLAREHAPDSQILLLVKEGQATRFIVLKQS
jgi:serine protease Do